MTNGKLVRLWLVYVMFLFFLLFNAVGQELFTLEKTIHQSGSAITTDDLGNIYIIQHEKIMKYDISGNLLETYDNKNYGDITSVDVTNPLKILVFYKDFNKIVFLDNTLSIKSDVISISDKGYDQALLVCASYQSGFWMYDFVSSQIIRFDKNLQKSNQSENLSQLLAINIHPSSLVEYNNYVYMTDTITGIFIFDRYGTYYKTISLKGIKSFQVFSDNLICCVDSFLRKYIIKTFEEYEYKLPVTKPLAVNISQNKLIVLNENGVVIYSSKIND